MKTITFLAVASLIVVLNAGAQSTIVNVPTNPVWTNTSVSVTAGSIVTINGNGAWNWGIGLEPVDGVDNNDGGNTFLELATQIGGGLVAYVGTVPPVSPWPAFDGPFTYQSTTQGFPMTTNFWEIGSSAQFYCPVSGTLYLGVDDDSTIGSSGDNVSPLIAQIFVGVGKTNDFKLPRPGLFVPQLNSAGIPESGNTVSFNVSGAAGSLWAVYDSSDLINWTFIGQAQINLLTGASQTGASPCPGLGNFANVSGLPYRFYKLDNGMQTSEPVPMVPECFNISGGLNHSAAVDYSGTVWAWGDNNLDQLGQPSTSLFQSSTPVEITTLSEPAISVSCGALYTLALMNDGTISGWGLNNVGQLGDSVGGITATPVQVQNTSGTLQNVTEIATFPVGTISMALTVDGNAWMWGGVGAFYGGSSTAFGIATNFMSGANAIAVGVGHTLILTPSGNVIADGDDQYGQCGTDGLVPENEGSYPYKTDTSLVKDVYGDILTDVISIAAGENSSYAIRSDGTVWAWGENEYGQLGAGVGTNSVTNNAAREVTFPQSECIVAVRAGNDHALAMATDGSLWAWGNNSFGQLGVTLPAGHTYSNVPVLLGYRTQASGSQWAGIAVGLEDSFSVINIPGITPQILSWGFNNEGQLGINSTTWQSSPVNVTNSTATAFFQF